MALPKHKDIELPLLREISEAGGEISAADADMMVIKHFPEITPEDLRITNKDGQTTWYNRVAWVRFDLTKKGEIDPSVWGVWRITEEGLKRLQREGWLDRPPDWVEAPTTPPAPTPAPVSPEPAPPPSVDIHKQLQDMLVALGGLLGKHAAMEFKGDIFTYDVVWKAHSSLPRATHVFEVQHKGNLSDALSKLKHAYDVWGSRLFLVVTDEHDRAKAEAQVAPLLAGLYHEISGVTLVLTAENVGELHATLTKYENTIHRMMSG